MTALSGRLLPLLDLLTQLGPGEINRITKPGPHCVLAATVGQMVLARFGITAEPYPVAIKVCNQAWLEWLDAGHPGGIEEQQRRGAYLLSNTPDWKGASFQTVKSDAPWDGHLVLRVPDGAQTWLVDLDLGSFSRPAHAIHLPGGVVAPITDGVVEGTFTPPDGMPTTVQYAPLVAPYAEDYQQARDWIDRARFRPVVTDLVVALKRAMQAYTFEP